MDRNEIVSILNPLYRRMEQLSSGGDARERSAANRQRVELEEAYLEWLPRVPVSRCPFTGAVVEHSFDGQGLDGTWWSYYHANRPYEQVPPTFFTLQGAVRLCSPVENAPFLCKPGPSVPYVIPRLLEPTEMRAVISSLPVGAHTAYLVSYFGQPLPSLQRINDWGSNQYKRLDEKGEGKWGEHAEAPANFDFELGSFIERGKLLWIAPGDESLTLVSTLQGCPYVGLSGTREIQRIQDGRVWSAPV